MILLSEDCPKKPSGEDGPTESIMYYVYLIKSTHYPEQFYIGYTSNLKERLAAHNNGQSVHTSKYKPWELVVFLGFANRVAALNFEKYLKSQSGRAFLGKRFM